MNNPVDPPQRKDLKDQTECQLRPADSRKKETSEMLSECQLITKTIHINNSTNDSRLKENDSN